MSTAGKVLSVLVILVAVAWIMLSATVAQLNRNGAKAVEDLKKQVAKLESDVVQAARDFDAMKESTHTEQLKTQNELTGLHARLGDVEKARSGVLETLSRVKLQLADAESVLKSGQAQSEEWQKEKDAEIKAKADEEESVKRIAAENEELLARLTAMRAKFQAMLQENKSLVERMLKAGAAPVPRRAALTR
jgi:hypothetical protein